MTPDSADGWYEAGRAALLRSFASDSHRELVADVEEGLAALDRAVALDPGHVPSLVDRALALSWLDRRLEAADALTTAVGAAPDRDDLRLAAARALQLAGRPAQAAAAYEALLIGRPSNPYVRWWLGETLDLLGRGVEADVMWGALGAPDPDDPLAQVARRLERIVPRPPDVFVRLVRAAARLESEGRRDEARARYRDAFRGVPLPPPMMHPTERLTRGSAAAREALLDLLRERWDQPSARRVAAQTLYRAGELEAALAACDAWAELDPTDHAPLGLRAETLVKVGGRGDEARAAWQAALDLAPDHVGYRARAAVYGWALDPPRGAGVTRAPLR